MAMAATTDTYPGTTPAYPVHERIPGTRKKSGANTVETTYRMATFGPAARGKDDRLVHAPTMPATITIALPGTTMRSLCGIPIRAFRAVSAQPIVCWNAGSHEMRERSIGSWWRRS
jgi:hypothetical protein